MVMDSENVQVAIHVPIQDGSIDDDSQTFDEPVDNVMDAVESADSGATIPAHGESESITVESAVKPELQQECPSTEGFPKSQPVDGLAEWISEMSDFREPEVRFLTSMLVGAMTVDVKGNLMAPIMVGDWMVLLVYDSRFPRETESGIPCAVLYFVDPLPGQIAAATGIDIDTFSKVGDGGNRYLMVNEFERFRKDYAQGHSSMLMAEFVSKAAGRLQRAYSEAIANAAQMPRWHRRTITASRYIDTRSSMMPGVQKHPACRKVVLSDRAFVQIYNETQVHFRTETGGLLLGHYENGVWYVVEASDPGWDAVFRPSYHEANEYYENHVCKIISRTYRYPLAFLGMWHRHPGSLDTFSGTDDATNSKYVDSCGNGCISALVNYDPDYRITFYYVERVRGGGVAYYQVDVEVGDDRFANPSILEVASVPGGAVGVEGTLREKDEIKAVVPSAHTTRRKGGRRGDAVSSANKGCELDVQRGKEPKHKGSHKGGGGFLFRCGSKARCGDGH